MAWLHGERWFHDREGRLVVFQVPNLPLVVWIVARLLHLVVDAGRPGRLLDALAFGALFTWAWLEVFDGSAHIRRILGLAVLVALLAAKAA